MNNQHAASRLPAEARINYIYVLASLENYGMPTNRHLSVEEIINKKIYSWYLQEQGIQLPGLDETDWFANYE
jgi:hypothetical protein